MSRLIDADKIIDSLGMSDMDFAIGAVIDEQPTAFDVDKVMERLKKELKLADKEKQRCAKENIYQFDEAKGYVRAIDVAIEIVKGGGADGN